MFRFVVIAGGLTTCALLTGCASIVSGQNQSLSVTSLHQGGQLAGAKCTLNNDKGTWYVTTPGSVTVRRSFNDLAVDCAHDGFDTGVSLIKSSTKGMAFGNILFGGIIGAGVDTATGAAYDYPEVIAVSLGAAKIDSTAAKAAQAKAPAKPADGQALETKAGDAKPADPKAL